MSTTILISVKNECENYRVTVEQAQHAIVSYFGTKYATVDEEMPVVKIDNVEVNNADINTLDGIISVCCDLLVIVNSDSSQVKGKFVFLNKE